MPISLPAAVAESADQAASKAANGRTPVRYLVSAMAAGAYIGVAVVLLAAAAGPFAAAGSAATKLVGGAVFGIALTLVVFAGAELFTSNAMVMLTGVLTRRVRVRDLVVVNIGSLVGNLAGSLGFAAIVHASGALTAGAKGGSPAPAAAMISSLARGKIAASDGQLFWRAVLCNFLVCLAIWMATRTKSDTAKLVVLFWGLLAFVTSGFEHSIANMTIFGLAVLQGDARWADLAHNLACTVPGNLVGGFAVAACYAFTGNHKTVRTTAAPSAVELLDSAEAAQPPTVVAEPATV
jgi:nitrite transporter NirC